MNLKYKNLTVICSNPGAKLFKEIWNLRKFMGVFLRGPGWNLFMPWQYWDPHKVVALTSVDLPYAFGFRDYTWSAMRRSCRYFFRSQGCRTGR